MSDFDKYFADRLDEEGQFPHREKNWKTLSKRLDAFDTGLSGRSSRMRYWQAAAAVSIIAVSVLFGKVYQMHRENAGLRAQIANLKKGKSPVQSNTPAEIGPIQKNESPDTTSITNPTAAEFELNSTLLQQKSETFATGEKTLTPGKQNTQPQYLPSGKNKFSETAPNKAGNRLLQSERTAVLPDEKTSDNTPVTDTDTKHFAQTQSVQDPKTKTDTLGMEMRPGQLLTDLALLPTRFQAINPAFGAPLPIKEIAVPAPIIKPVKHNFSKYRIGVQALAGFPKPQKKGISPLTGAGISAEYTVLKNLRLNASADWLRHEVNCDSFVDRHHFPDAPNKPKPDHKLSQIEASQRSQYYTLGIAYTLPFHFPVKPAIRIAHTWAHWTPAIYSFRFDKKGPTGPSGPPKFEYEPKKSEPDWTVNNWRVGAGLEFETPRWIAGVWADYSKNLATQDPTFDAVFIRAGVEYKFD